MISSSAVMSLSKKKTPFHCYLSCRRVLIFDRWTAYAGLHASLFTGRSLGHQLSIIQLRKYLLETRGQAQQYASQLNQLISTNSCLHHALLHAVFSWNAFFAYIGSFHYNLIYFTPKKTEKPYIYRSIFLIASL